MINKMKEIIKLTYRGILELLYPLDNRCIICNKEDVQGICNKCMNDIEFSIDDDSCIGYYKGTLKQLILNFKYKNDYAAGQVLVDLLERKITKEDSGFYLAYIPMTKKV